METYLQSCKSDFWKTVFAAELDYILHQLQGTRDILSIGCGPAIIEGGLAEYGFNVTGLDISREALDEAPDGVRTVAGSADKLDFADERFDAVIYVASLQFIENDKQSIRESARVLRPAGKLVALLLNPQSAFFKEKRKNPDSYVNKIKHTDLKETKNTAADLFYVDTEYYLGITTEELCQSNDPDIASLYVIKGIKKQGLQTGA